MAWRRFIPAPAGNSRHPLSPGITCPVHPRACGEQSTPMSLMEDDLQATVIPTNIPPAGGGHYNSHQHALFPGGGAKLTSFSPSNSRGIRRLIPTVSKSKP